MGRLRKTTNAKKISRDCIFCGKDYFKKRIMISKGTNINYLYVKPLGLPYRAVCDNCEKTTLKDFKLKYPDLFE